MIPATPIYSTPQVNATPNMGASLQRLQMRNQALTPQVRNAILALKEQRRAAQERRPMDLSMLLSGIFGEGNGPAPGGRQGASEGTSGAPGGNMGDVGPGGAGW